MKWWMKSKKLFYRLRLSTLYDHHRGFQSPSPMGAWVLKEEGLDHQVKGFQMGPIHLRDPSYGPMDKVGEQCSHCFLLQSLLCQSHKGH